MDVKSLWDGFGRPLLKSLRTKDCTIMREKLRRFMIGRYGTDGLNQFLSIASLVLLLIAIVSRISLFTWLGVVLLGFCY